MPSLYRTLTIVTAALLGACARHPAPAVRYAGHSESLALAEARAIEAAKRHPNAQPRVRPQLPEQAPPPLAAGQTLPPPLHISRRSTPRGDAPQQVTIERTVYDDSAYRYRPWYSYRRPWGFGARLGWNPYGYGYGYGYGHYSRPRARYGYGYGAGLGFSAPLWGSRHLAYPSYGRGHHLGWSRPHYDLPRRGGSVRWVSGRRR